MTFNANRPTGGECGGIMKITKWLEMSDNVTIHIGTEDIRAALDEAFAAANQTDVNVRDIFGAFNSIASFLNAFTDENIAKLKPKQREIIGRFLRDAAARFIQDEDKTP